MTYDHSKYKTFEEHLEAYDNHIRYQNEPIFNPEDLPLFKYKIDQYFAECAEKGTVPRLTGLSIHLGMTRKTLNDYSNKKGFSSAYKLAVAKIEDYIVGEVLREDRRNVAGAIFILKAVHGFIEKQHLDVGSSVVLKIDKDDAKL
jgi:hypothetical protein